MSSHLPINHRFLHTFADGAELVAVSARWFIQCPPWEGQRTLDAEHVRMLVASVTQPRTLEGPYVLAILPGDDIQPTRFEIVDGQHRAEVLRHWFRNGSGTATDFYVLVRLVVCPTDMDVIDLFRRCNTKKPLRYEYSPEQKQHELVKLLVAAFQRRDTTGNKITEMIRSGARGRPVLATESLLHEIRAQRFFHEGATGAGQTPEAICDAIQTWNAQIAADPYTYLATLRGITPTMRARAIQYSFFLGLDPHLRWLKDIVAVTATAAAAINDEPSVEGGTFYRDP